MSISFYDLIPVECVRSQWSGVGYRYKNRGKTIPGYTLYIGINIRILLEFLYRHKHIAVIYVIKNHKYHLLRRLRHTSFVLHSIENFTTAVV